MRINGLSSMIGSTMVDQINEMDRLPVEQSKKRRDKVTGDRNEFNSFAGLLDGLGGALDGLKTPSAFTKLKIDSSHPELLDGDIVGPAEVGSYEFEVKGLAKVDRQLAFGFADPDKTPVGFGFMQVAQGDKKLDVVIDPGSTLRNVADKINEVGGGMVKAMVVNTGAVEDPFRLMVSSLETGEDAQISIDEDTTFTEFKNQVTGSNLDLNFEDISVTRAKNSFKDLIDGVQLRAKQAEPGTKIQFDVKHDVGSTFDGIKSFVDKYNQLADFTHKQVQVDTRTGRAGNLAGDSTLRTVMRRLQSAISSPSALNHAAAQEGSMQNAIKNLSEIGITTNAKTGSLQINEDKVKAALAENYQGVAGIFANTENGEGLAGRLDQAIKQLKDRETGAITTRLKGLDAKIQDQDKQIERQVQRVEERQKQTEARFARLDAKLAGMQGQEAFFGAAFGAGAAPSSTPTPKAKTA